jgi:hypothetical protein
MNSIEKITDDALLLAYVAGELEGEEMEQLEARLSADRAMKARASQLRNDYQLLMQTMAQLDVENHASKQTALSQVNQLMRQWHGVRQTAAVAAPVWRWHPPIWSYAAAAAVAMFAGLCLWWANGPPNTSYVDSQYSTPTTEPVANVTPDVHSAPAESTDSQPEQMPLAFQSFSSDDSDQLADLEKDAVALSQDSWSANSQSSNTNQ